MTFDRLAPHYDWLEAVIAGRRLEQVRAAWLDDLEGRQRILSVGEGHGRFAAACARRNPAAELTCVEASRRMLWRAHTRAARSGGRVRWHLADVRTWQPTGTYDAIVTCFFLDCFPPQALAEIIGRLAAWATPDALWLVTDFAVPSRGPARLRARAVHALMYAFFRRVVGLPARRLTPPDALLQTQGFTLVGRRTSEWGLLHADLWRRTGAGGDGAGPTPRLPSRGGRP
jgi:ubiquinone/menaquinone biosynthesis C-methylase UbiE